MYVVVFTSFPWCWGAEFLIRRPWWPCWKTFSDLQPSYLTMLSTLSGPFALSGKHDRNNLLLLLLRYSCVPIFRQKARNMYYDSHFTILSLILQMFWFNFACLSLFCSKAFHFHNYYSFGLLASWIASFLSIFVERPHRRTPLTTYVANVVCFFGLYKIGK